MSDTNVKQTVIEDGTEFEGSVTSKAAIVLSGKLKGELRAPTLTVTATGSVRGQIKVERLVSAGEVSGEIEAESVELSGKIGDQTVIHADKLEVRLAQPNGGVKVTFGTCELRVGDKRAKNANQPHKDKEREGRFEPEPVL